MLPLENGFTSMAVNWASMKNQGIEINLQTRNIATKDFSWYTSFNFAYNQNKVLKVMTEKDPSNSKSGRVTGWRYFHPKNQRDKIRDRTDIH